jgi:hypothetical protein
VTDATPYLTGPHGSLYLDYPASAYYSQRLGIASKSALDQVAKSPAHYRAWLDGHREVTAAMQFGTAVHTAVLESDKFDRQFVAEPDFGDCRYKAAKEARDAWRAANAGKQTLSADHAAAIAGIHASIDRRTSARIEGGFAEVTALWVDPETGIEGQSRLDYLITAGDHAVVIDLKTTANASPAGFARSVEDYRYHVQVAVYEHALALCGLTVDRFVFIAVEKEPPYEVGFYVLPDEWVERGRKLMRRDLNTLWTCMELDQWPGYADQVLTLEPPRWAARAWEFDSSIEEVTYG